MKKKMLKKSKKTKKTTKKKSKELVEKSCLGYIFLIKPSLTENLWYKRHQEYIRSLRHKGFLSKNVIYCDKYFPKMR